MVDPTLFKGSRAKLARARENLQGLELEFQRFSDSKPYELRQEYDSETDEIILVYYPIGEIPDNWSVIAGEILFNLRSALDLAIEELTIREQGTPLKNTEFPIFNDKAVFSEVKNNGDTTNRSGLYKIRGLNQKTINYIESLQPYHIIEPDKVSILSLLHEMNNRDKHRELHLCRQMAFSAKIILIEDVPNIQSIAGPPLGGNLDERTIIGWLKTAKPLDDSKVYMDAEVVLQIVFDESSSSTFKKQESVIGILNALGKGVGGILNTLETTL